MRRQILRWRKKKKPTPPPKRWLEKEEFCIVLANIEKRLFKEELKRRRKMLGREVSLALGQWMALDQLGEEIDQEVSPQPLTRPLPEDLVIYLSNMCHKLLESNSSLDSIGQETPAAEVPTKSQKSSRVTIPPLEPVFPEKPQTMKKVPLEPLKVLHPAPVEVDILAEIHPPILTTERHPPEPQPQPSPTSTETWSVPDLVEFEPVLPQQEVETLEPVLPEAEDRRERSRWTFPPMRRPFLASVSSRSESWLNLPKEKIREIKESMVISYYKEKIFSQITDNHKSGLILIGILILILAIQNLI